MIRFSLAAFLPQCEYQLAPGRERPVRQSVLRTGVGVLHFDLRIAGFADLGSLYMSLSQQMEQFFDSLSKDVEGYEDFEKEAWGFKVCFISTTNTQN